MPLLMAELPVFGGRLVPTELRAHRRIDKFGEIVRRLDIRRQAEEHVAHLARRVLFAPDAAVADVGDGANTAVDRDAFAVARLIDAPLARRRADLHVAERQVVAVEQLRHLRGGGQRLAFGAAVGDGLGAQGLDARPEFVARLATQGLMPISFWAVPPRMAMRSASLRPGVDSTRSTSVAVHGNG